MAPAALVEPVVVVLLLVDVDPVLVDAPVLEVLVCDVVEVELVLEVESFDADDVFDVSALATPVEVTTITPIPRAAANAPTRPTKRP